jgi:hypothetical protein
MTADAEGRGLHQGGKGSFLDIHIDLIYTANTTCTAG